MPRGPGLSGSVLRMHSPHPSPWVLQVQLPELSPTCASVRAVLSAQNSLTPPRPAPSCLWVSVSRSPPQHGPADRPSEQLPHVCLLCGPAHTL